MKYTPYLIKVLLCSAPLWMTGSLYAQSEKPIKDWYSMSATEFIFSKGTVESDSIHFDPVVRFTVFLHLQFQSHYNFSSRVGIYTGLGSRNVGIINKFDHKGDEVKIKQRAYSIGIPLALKFGKVTSNKFVAIGIEEEMMFNYKRKVFFKDDKSVSSKWFSNQVNLFNPSLFAEIHFSKRSYIKFKYYLDDFLQDREMVVNLDGTTVSYKPTSSKMYYLSVGTIIIQKKKKHATKSEV